MSIKGFRLTTGEVILAQVVVEEAESYEINKAAQLVTQEVEPGKMGVLLQPFIPFSKGNISLVKYSINAVFELDLQVENEYNRIFGSGIQIVGAGSTILK